MRLDECICRERIGAICMNFLGLPRDHLGGGFKHFLFSSISLGKMSKLTNDMFQYFSDGLKPPISHPSLRELLVETSLSSRKEGQKKRVP